MSTTIRVDTLNEIVKSYTEDSNHQKWEQQSRDRRQVHIVRFSEIARQFVDGKLNLKAFCDALTVAFKETGESWSAKGYGFMSPMYKISKSHGPAAQDFLRELLTDLNAENMGVKIELFYKFLQTERARLRREGIPPGSIAEAGKSAMIISLFASWLHPEQEPIVYHEETRSAFAWLINQGLFAILPNLRVNGNIIIVTTNSDHQAFQTAINNLLAIYPMLQSSPYWSEYFFGWLAGNKPVIVHPDHDPLIDISIAEPPSLTYLNNEPLLPIPEPLLTDLIHEVQRHILVEEVVIRRIYHALLAGHVVLSGPPGTGKTELARLLPEILWHNVENESEENSDGHANPSAYTTRLVTATDEWSVRTLISGIAPVSKNGSVAYKIQYGHLTSAILKNWSAQGETPEKWSTLTLRRTPVTSNSSVERDTQQIFRGQWLVIDEFNRAPIDLALGEALTALGGNDVLRVMTEDGSMELPIPKDFRVIGTLNSFDRNYLNQISEALKRRFSFVEILPPGRSSREAEQAIVLYKSLERVSHLSKEIVTEENGITWSTLGIEANPDDGQYATTWSDEPHPFREAFEAAWRVFETIRVYRQLGTAQAIGLVRHMLIAGILQGYTTLEQWIGEALDAALCDTIADQLQVLLPDEIEILLLALTSERAAFSAAYHRLLANLADRQQRLYGQLLALGRVSNEHGVAYLSDEEIEASAQSNPPTVAEAKLRAIFHLDAPLYRLPQFTRRLRAFKAERGL